MYNKEYYEEKQKDIVEQVNKIIQKKVNSDYEFVREHSELVQKYNQIAEQIKAEQLKEETKTPPTKVKSK